MIALSPLLSWLLIGVVAGFAATVYLLASGWLDRRERDLSMRWDRDNGVIYFPPETSAQEMASFVRIFGGVYDHEAHGDFHDPIRDHEWCDDCNARLRRAFNDLADLDLGPRDADALMASIRRALES